MNLHISASSPFAIQKGNQGYGQVLGLVLYSHEKKKILIKFKPEINHNKISHVFNETLIITFKEHSKKVPLFKIYSLYNISFVRT